MSPDSETYCHHKRRKKRSLVTLALVAVASAVWFAIRTGTKPSRIMYPCQQAALANISLFKSAVSVSIPSIASLRASAGWVKPVAILSILTIGGVVLASDPISLRLGILQDDSNLTRVPIVLSPQTAANQENASDLFFVQNVTGPEGDLDSSLTELIDLMMSQGLHFYNTSSTPDGLIGSNDVVIIKMNGQWDYRGGTNTDLIKSIINMIITHPDGFIGEVVIADNGQGIGYLDRYNPNSYYQNKSAQDVADFFAPEWNVSTILWDSLRTSTVEDYNNSDFADGYVRSSDWNEETELFVSYPKFQSPVTGVYISFKQGVWSNDTGFDSNRLKVINMPVLKTHLNYGVTGCIKHYMGVPQGHIVQSIDSTTPHEHFAIANGGLGELMAKTRAPVLNILDMIWVNPHPLESSAYVGPWSRYTQARATDIIGASQDPVALDYWSSKHVLIPTAQYLNYTDYTSLDPDNETIRVSLYYQQMPQVESFHNYLERSMNQLKDAGFQVTMDETEMNVFVVVMSDTGPVTPTTPGPTGLMQYLPVVIGVVVLGVFILAVVIVKRRNS